jgi:hypothetical protein
MDVRLGDAMQSEDNLYMGELFEPPQTVGAESGGIQSNAGQYSSPGTIHWVMFSTANHADRR